MIIEARKQGWFVNADHRWLSVPANLATRWLYGSVRAEDEIIRYLDPNGGTDDEA